VEIGVNANRMLVFTTCVLFGPLFII